VKSRWLRGGAALFALAVSVEPLAAAADKAKSAAAPVRPDSDAPWKVEEAHGPSRTVAFTTEEATWLALDVHPDGQRVVFSLLGDLYLLPISGGEAKRITSGTGYDVQPRFSPDGRTIAFASDRGGIENLWICDLEGKNARPVSTEKDTTVNSPAWSPDGDYLVGRKRLTDQSSLGTVELWMWHVKGGQGVQLTKKDEQPEAADPAFSRDGRFILFSARDSRYRYDRNVNEGIWQVKRLDRRTGQTVPLTGEFGGAAAPTPSPDGKSLAYVRRVRARTVLEVLEVASGKVRRVAGELQRDNQEGFAFHGVFPGFAWTPDGRSLLVTAEGRIWRYDVASGARAAVPFTAAVEQRVTEAVRFPQTVGGDTVRVRIVRWPVESPDGKRLVFSAVGHLYAMDLPGGTPRRLTTLPDLEYAPAFSADGRSLTFVTWNDAEGGHVWTLPMGSEGAGNPRRLTTVPGQYVNPSFSPDGSRVVFLSGSGAWFRENDLSDELWHEVRWVGVEGGEAHYVVGTRNRGTQRRMPRPMFSRDGERVYFVENEPPAKPAELEKAVLVSVKLDGTDRKAHLRFARAEEAVVSPDGRWVVFNELHNAYVTALPETGGQTVEVSLDGAALPLGQLTNEGGEWVGWADGGRTVTWVFGPTYHRLALDQAVPTPKVETDSANSPPQRAARAAGFTPDASAGGQGGATQRPPAQKEKTEKEKKSELPKSQAIEITLTLPRARPTEVVAYRGARVVTMKGDEVIERGTIVVEGNRIVAVGPEASVTVPAGARTVDLSGRTVIPGLFDEHAHLHYSTLDIFPQRPWKYLANLAYGITSTHDPSASTQEVFGQAEMVEAGLLTGPRIFSTGFVLYGADHSGRAVIKSLDDARHHLRRLKALGAFTVKSYMQPRREARQWIIQAAREEGMMVVPEGGGDLEGDITMILDGHTTIEHSLPITPLRKDVVTVYGQSATAYTPTLLVAFGGPSGDKWFHQHYDLWKDERLQRYVPQAIVDTLGRIRTFMATDEDWHHIDVAAGAKQLLDAGTKVNLGGHGQMQGLGPHWELWTFVKGGMTPLQALRVGTLNPAQTLGLDRDLGSIEKGKLADFVVLERNPLEKIENTDSVALVVKNGRAYTPRELERRAEATN
jgi:Tol biopolymer transport system component/imidazolonepropionase-like amidohydrolase